MSLFCRSSSVVSGEISLGTALRPKGQCCCHQCEPWLWPQSGSGHRDTHTHRHTPRDAATDSRNSRAGRQSLFSFPTHLQPDNWTAYHTEISTPKPAQGHPIFAPTLPHLYHRIDMCPLDRGTQAGPASPHTSPDPALKLT